MKRGQDGGSGMRSKKLRAIKKFTGRVLINSPIGGELIGRGGSVIRAIRDAYRTCKVDIPDTQHKLRVVQVDCEEHADLANCITEITEKMKQCAKEFVPNLPSDHGAVQLLINGDALQQLVQGGLTFLREANANVEFPEGFIEQSSDRKLIISGDMTSINKVLRKLFEKFSEESSPNGDSDTWFDPNDGKGGPDQRRKESERYGRGGGNSGDCDANGFRVLVPANRTGVIIGSKGSVIKELRETGCDVDMPDIDAPYKVCKVRTDGDPENVFKCMEKMLHHCEKAYEHDLNLKRGETGIKFLIHTSVAGKVIGSGGEEIKNARSESGCDGLKISGDCIPGTTDRIVTAIGEKDTCLKAMRIIGGKVHGLEARGRRDNLEDIANKTSGKATQGSGPEGWRAPQQGGWHSGPPQQQPPQVYYGGAPPQPNAPQGWQPPQQQQPTYYTPPQQGYGQPPPQQPQQNYYRQPQANVQSNQWQQPPPQQKWGGGAAPPSGNQNSYSQNRW